MFISTKQLNEIIETNKAQQAQIEALTAQVSALQLSIKERSPLSEGEIEEVTEQLIDNDDTQYAFSEWVNDYLGANIDDYVTSYIDNHRYVVTDLVDDKVDEIFEEVTIKIER